MLGHSMRRRRLLIWFAQDAAELEPACPDDLSDRREARVDEFPFPPTDCVLRGGGARRQFALRQPGAQARCLDDHATFHTLDDTTIDIERGWQ